MFARWLKMYALAIPPFALCSVGGCSALDSASRGGSGQSGGVVINGDSGVVQDTPPPGCPGPGPAGDVAPPVGTLIASGNSLSTRGVTSDGYEIYSDDFALQLYAVPIAGGASQSIASLGAKFWVTVVGQVVFVWSNVTDANVGALTIWSSAHGAQELASASFGILGASSLDGSRVLYVANVDPQGQTGDVLLAGADGSGVTSLLQGQQLSGCFPQLGFAGSYAIASHCDTPRGDGPSATISSFPSPSWSRTDLVTGAENVWSADTAGTILLVSTGGGVMVVPVGGGPTKTLDTSGFLGQLIAGGQAAIYSTMAGDLRRSSTSTPSPTTLASPPFGGFYGVSPSQSTVLYYGNQDSSGTDIYLASTVTPGTPQTLCPGTNGAIDGDTFTADSAYALYSTSNDVCTGAATFAAFPVTGGGSPISLGTNVWGDWSATGAKVVFNDHFVATGGLRFGRADIEAVDLAAGATPTLVVSQADAVIDMSPAKDQIVYSWSVQPGDLAGIYVTPVP